MGRFVQGEDRRQDYLLPASLDDYVSEENPVRAIEAFIDALDLKALEFAGMTPAETGRPAYHPATMLKIYLYGYLNRVQSSRRLEREAQRNIELMWLTGRLAPDFKTIANFRRANGAAIRSVCSQFIVLCRQLGLFTRAVVAIDGSKMKAVNNRDKNYTAAKVASRMKQVQDNIDRYLDALDRADREESDIAEPKAKRLTEKIARLRAQLRDLAAREEEVRNAPDQQVSLTDPDARAMASAGRGTSIVGYNLQAAVDAEHHLIVAHELLNTGYDRGQLAPMAAKAKDAMGVEALDAIADKGYFKGEDVRTCEGMGVTAFVPRPLTSGSKAQGRFGKPDFVYLEEENVYRCPAGEDLIYRYTSVEDGLTKPGPGFSAGEALSTPEAVRLLARGAVRKVKSWEALHRSLARVGLRYEPYIADGEIEGGYIVPNLALVDDAHQLKGSDVNAGYGRLVEKLRGEYQPPPPGLKIQRFLHPTYRGLDDEEPEEESAQSLKREQSAKLEEEIDELAAHLKRARERQDEDERLAADAEKAKLEKDRSAKLAVHNARQRAQKARREADEELLAGLKVSAQQSGAKPKRGRRSKTRPIPGVFWGDPDSKNQAAADWRQRYVIETNGPKTTYSVNQAPAFVETKNFVAMHTHDRQAAMDALRCAHEKFGTVKITGTPQFRREMILLALEMEIPLDIRHTFEARKLRKQVAEAKEKASRDAAEKAGKVIYEAKASTHPANVHASQRDDPKGVERKGHLTEEQKQQQVETKPAHTSSGVDAKPVVSLKPQSEAVRPSSPSAHANPMSPKPSHAPPRLTQKEKADIDARKERASIFADHKLDHLFKLNRQRDRVDGQAAALNRAHYKLGAAPLDEMLLVSSLFASSDKRLRYLDDEILLKHFHDQPETLVRPEVQRHLAAIAAVHHVRRQWIMAQCAAGKISLAGVQLDVDDSIADEHKDWLVPFIRGQKSDPKFLRQLEEARSNRIEVPGIRLDLRPELQLWQHVRAGKLLDEASSRFVADELFGTSTPDNREKMFKQISYEDAQALRKTQGRWAEAYRGYIYRKPSETDRQWQERRDNAERQKRRDNRGR